MRAHDVMRFWKLVEVTDGCWLWRGATDPKGYGRFGVRLAKGVWKTILAHRASLLIFGVSLPAHMCALHKCDNPPCVRPDHFTVGTRRDNNADMYAKRRNRHPAGESAGKAKLTVSDVLAIRAVGYTVSRSELARRYGVHRRTILTILRREIWKGVPA